MKSHFFKLPLNLFLIFAVSLPAFADNTKYIQQAKSMAAALGNDDCPLLNSRKEDVEFKPQIHEFTYKYNYSDEQNKARLIQILCWHGAYSESHVFILFKSPDAGSLLSFTRPDYEVKYENGDSDGAVKSIKVTGFSSRNDVVFADFDPKTLELHELHKSRGIGDAYTTALWRFENGKFSLKEFSVDASYDGESKAQTIINYK